MKSSLFPSNNYATAKPANCQFVKDDEFDSDKDNDTNHKPSLNIHQSHHQENNCLYESQDFIDNNYDLNKIELCKSINNDLKNSSPNSNLLHSNQSKSSKENISEIKDILDFDISNSINKLLENFNQYNDDGILKENDNIKQFLQENEFIPKKLNARDYQMKIFEEAKNKNSIVFLETGKGKTFIAILIMEYMLGINKNAHQPSKNKKIIFFVCDSALVKQQQHAIQNQLGIEVGTLQGKKSKKSKSDYNEFRETYDSKNIFVAIPDVVYKLLSIGFLKINEVDLLVFDECHHTDANHVYNAIMNEFYFFYKRKFGEKYKLPLILGLTASPLKTKIGQSIQLTAQKSITNLCENLDAQMITDPELMHLDESLMKEQLQNKEYLKVNYHIEHKNYDSLIQFIYENFLKRFALFALSSITMKKDYYDIILETLNEQYLTGIQMRFQSRTLVEYNNCFQNLPGLAQLAEDNIVLFIFEKIQRHLFMLLENLNLEAIVTFFTLYTTKFDQIKDKKEYDDSCILGEIMNLHQKQIKELAKLFLSFVEKLKVFSKAITYESDRLAKLYNKINELFTKNPESKCIVFVPNRIVSFFLEHALNKYLSNMQSNKKYKCISVIGVNKKKTSSTINPTNSLNILNEKIQKFNRGDVQVLIGTSTVEEGLDIQTCNVVMVFTELNTAKSYIQMNGRARQKNSKFLAFTSSPLQTQENIKKFIILSQCMRELFQGKISKDFKKEDYMDDKGILRIYYEIPETQAKITIRNSIQMYNEIYQNFIQNQLKFIITKQWDKKKNPKEDPEFLFQCIIKFEGIFGSNQIKSKYYTDKSSSESECYIHIITLFHKAGLVDNYFKFTKKKK